MPPAFVQTIREEIYYEYAETHFEICLSFAADGVSVLKLFKS